MVGVSLKTQGARRSTLMGSPEVMNRSLEVTLRFAAVY